MKKFLLIGLLTLPSLLLAQAPVLTFDPTNGATNVLTSGNLTITSDVALNLAADGTDLSDTNVDALITLMDNVSNPVGFDATVDGPRKVITITPNANLSELTTYTLTLQPVESNSGAETTTQVITFTTGDFTDPVINYAQGVDNSGTAFTFVANVNENATIYYIVDTDDSTTPTRTQIINGNNGSNATADASGSFTVSAGVDGFDNITGLSFSPTKYFVFYFAEDVSANANPTSVGTRGLPVLNSSSIQNLQAFQFDLRVNVDENATTYYVVTQSATVPTASRIRAGQDESGGTPVAAGSFTVNANTNTNKTISGLDDGITYYVHFVSTDGSENQTVVETESATTPDGTPPSVTSVTPSGGSTAVDISTNTVTITFGENIITSASSASGGSDLIKLFEEGVMKEDILRGDGTVGTDGSIVISGSTATVTFVYALKPHKNYYITIGDDVFSDAAGNDFAGYSANTDWNFTTSGVTANNANSSICSGSFQSIGNIVISETGVADFNTGSSRTLTLSLANTSDFAISNSGVSVSGASADISGFSLSFGLTSLTLTYSVSGGTVLDNITVSGLKVYATGDITSTTIIRTGGDGDMDGGNGTGGSSLTYATISVGSSAPSPPQLAASQDLIHCAAEDISAKTVALVSQGSVTYKWYHDAALSSLAASTTSTSVNIASDLGLTSPAVEGSYDFYVVTVDGCQSAALPVSIEVAPIPVADAGPAAATVCSGSSITLGGSPTLIGPSVTGTYQYLWSTSSPTGFVDMGANPTVSPVSDTDITLNYTVKIVDANGCASDILDPNATIAVDVDSTDEVIVYNSPLSTSFTLNSDPIELKATPSINSSYSGNGVYLSNGKYYFDPDLAGTAGSPHPVTYFTNLTNGCPKTEVRNFAVSNSSSTIVNLAGSYCSDEGANPSKVLSLGTDWSNNLAANNAYYSANYGYTYEFYDFQAYTSSGTVGPGVVYPTPAGAYPDAQHIDPALLQPYVSGASYTYVGMRVRRRYPETFLGIPTGNYLYDPPTFWSVQYVNLYAIPALKVTGIRNGQVLCDLNETIELEANFNTGTYQISRDGTNWVTGPSVGLVDSPVNSGKALLNPHDAYISTSFPAPDNVPASGVADFYIRYTYVVPNTSSSTSTPCDGIVDIAFKISSNPAVSWEPLTKTEFCFEDMNAAVNTVAPDPSDPSLIDAISGYGVFDNGNRTATFDPDEALKAKAFATNSPAYTNYNSPEDIIIYATRKDANGCQTTINQTVKVHPLFPASFTESDLDVCYEDGPQNIVGAQPNGAFVLFNPNLTVNFAQTTINGFNLRTYYDDAVALGADGTINQKFDLTFNTSDPVLHCANSVTKTFSVNPPIPMDIGGMTSDLLLCGNGSAINLTGNQPGAGSFEISTSQSSGFVANALGLTNTTSGKATYNPAGAGLTPGTPKDSLYVRYSFLGPGCTGMAQTTERLIINPQPAISFSSSIPAANTKYCFEQGTSPTTVAITTSPLASDITLAGFGITDNGGGNAIFNPTAAYQQSSLAENLNPQTDQTVRNIIVTAMRTDTYSCSNSANVTYIVNPLPTATFSPAQKEFCFEDPTVTLSGGQTNVSWEIIYKNTTTPPNYSAGPEIRTTKDFEPGVLFQDATDRGANNLATLQFDVVYTSINSATGCTNRKDPVTFTVSPKIPVDIAGINDGDIFCSNTTDKVLTFNPPNGTFRIDNNIVVPVDNKYIFDPPISGPASGTDYTFKYTLVTGNNCTNTQIKTIKVLPSPRAIFNVVPQCDTALIAYNADPSTNLSSAVYTWTLSDSVRTGRNIEHRFPGVSTYPVQLNVEHPAYMGDPSLVCADSMRLDQIIGPYPRDVDFKYFNVCEGDNTDFQVTSSIPLSRVSWDFGDGENTGLGIVSNPVSGPRTTGTYQEPIHTYVGSYDGLQVTVVGQTSTSFGGCETARQKDISILKKWTPTPAEPYYDMSQLDGGKGFWVREDVSGNSSWEFNTVAKSKINTGEMAWVTGATDPYKANDVSYVNSPCFDLSSFSRPVISVKHWTDTEFSDGAVMQYSVDGGETWERLGNVASGLEWYNRLTISSNPGEQTDLSSGWSVSETTATASGKEGKHTLDVLPGGRSQVRFRVAFSSFNNLERRDGFAFNNVVIEERNRTILAENFTTLADTANNHSFFRFRTNKAGVFNTDEVVKLEYHHGSGATTDTLNQDNPTDQNARAAFYGVNTPVRAFIDGGFGQRSTNATYSSPDLATYFSLRSLVTSPIEISVDFVTDPSDKLNVKATVQAMTGIGNPGQYNVFIAVAEQRIVDEAGDTIASYVLRKLLPDASGTPLTSLSASDPAQEIIASYDMRHVTKLSNGDYAPFAVIVFVQNLETKEVLQTAIRQDGTASSNIVTGIETSSDQYIKLYPNPSDDRLNIILPSLVKAETLVRIFDTFGKQVYEGSFRMGENVKQVDTKSLSAGVYLIQLSTPEGLVRKKAMVVHQ